LNHIEYCNALEIEVARFSDVMSLMSRDTEITTCPGWSVVDLAEHLGLIHRWAEELVRLRSPERISRTRSVDDRASVSPDWITEGGDRLIATLRDADPDDQMWAWGSDQHVRFWSRRQLHETLVHRMDLEISDGVEPHVDTAVAIDAIDEFLENLEGTENLAPDSVLRGHGETLVIRLRDAESLWSITMTEDRLAVSKLAEKFDAEVVGSALELLLVILRRREVERAAVQVIGDSALLKFWLDHSAF
jgi:uncharacterized protein (TIGR03083 family)